MKAASITKDDLANMTTNMLFEIKGILEREDAIRGENGKSAIWEVFSHTMKVYEKKWKKYKFITGEIKGLDKFYDELGDFGFDTFEDNDMVKYQAKKLNRKITRDNK